MQMARQKSREKIFKDEKMHLAPDADNFLQALSRRSEIDQKEMTIYNKLSSIVIEVTEEESLDDHISNLIDDVQDLIIYAA